MEFAFFLLIHHKTRNNIHKLFINQSSAKNNLRNVEEANKVSHCCGDGGSGRPNHRDGRWDVSRAVTELIQVERIDLILRDEAQRRLQSFRDGVTRVKYTVTERDVGKKSGAVVDLLYSENHGLKPTEPTKVISAKHVSY